MFTLYNIAAYQAVWFACVLTAANGAAWMGIVLALIVVGVHVALAANIALEFKLIGAAIAIGLLVDSALTRSGQIAFAAGAWADGWAPWMLALWAAFATTLNHSLRWLMDRRVLAAMMGAVGGPLAYLAGAKLGALQIPSPETALPFIAVAWAAAMFGLSIVAARVRPKAAQPAPVDARRQPSS
ncbi:MAG: DUF2878 domain-containing protein [Steroidobacteraceae bacterium]